VKEWTKKFADPEQKKLDQKRLQEIAVLLSELEGVRMGGAVYQGSEKTVFFQASPGQVVRDLKKEQGRLVKAQREV